MGQSKADAGERDSLRPVGAFAVRHTVGAALARRCHILVATLLDVCAMEIDVDKMVLLLQFGHVKPTVKVPERRAEL